MESMLTRTIVAEGQEIQYHLERKPVKNLNLRIRKDGEVFVSASAAVPDSEVDNFVCRKAGYILEAINKFEELAQYKPQPKQYVSGETFYIQGRGLRLQLSQANKDSISSDGVYIYLAVKNIDDFEKKRRMLSRFLVQQCEAVFGEIISELYPMFRKYGVDTPILRIRDMETRWGSCLAKKGIITLNKRLIEAPRNCIEYVVMHELCHFIHPNHSKQFYSFLTMLMPDWRQRKALLEKCAAFLL
ncbi:MAG: SprT family zinc-dependent metalloprotease [Candidatus Limivicinus sp.]|nr:SprT family zinc-dependent metalloprotease [Candidatus Limivicinus sp.]